MMRLQSRMTVAEIAKKLKRTHASVESRLQKLGISRAHAKEANDP